MQSSLPIAVFAAALCGGFTLPAICRGAEAPNIVLIMADDAGAECFGCYGGESYSTPNVDRMAAEGIRFTHCFSQPLCTPSRVKLMTGLSNIRNYKHFGILPPGQATFAHTLRSAGYRTCVVGKWQLYGPKSYGERAATGTLPGEAGFDEHCLWQVDRRQSRYWSPLIVENGMYRDDLRGRYGPDLFWEYAAAFLERNRSAPFFLYYPMCLPHDPFLPTPDSTDLGTNDRAKNFADMIAYTDKNVGRILAKLEELDLSENTLVLFTCDNGTHRSITSRARGRLVRGGKGETTNAGTHVPLVARWPAVVEAGSVCGDLIDFCDFLPTFAELARTAPPEGLDPDGRSFLPQLRGETGSPREWIVCYYHPRPEREGTRATLFARDHRFKLYGDGRLYDVQSDPLEQSPLEGDALTADVVAAKEKLRATIESFP